MNVPSEVSPKESPSRRRSRSPVRSGMSALVDQALVSGTTFLTMVLVGRYAGAEQLGIFSLCYSVIVLIAAIQRALISSAYTYQSQSLRPGRLGRRRGSALLLALAVTLSLSLLIAGGMGLAQWLGAAKILPPMVFASVAVAYSMRDFVRRILFADHRFLEATFFDGFVVLVQLAVLVYLALTERMRADSALAALTVANSTATIGWMLLRQRDFVLRQRSLQIDTAASWRFGRWVMLSEGAFATQEVAVQAMLAAGTGFAGAGAYAACMSLVRLANPVTQAIGNAVGPLGAQALAEGGIDRLMSGVSRVTGLMVKMAVVYLLFMLLVGSYAVEFLYDGRSPGNRWLLFLLSLATAVGALGMPPAKAVSAVLAPRLNLYANLASFVVTLAMGALSFQTYGSLGVATAVLAGAAISCGLKWWFYWQVTRMVAQPAEVH